MRTSLPPPSFRSTRGPPPVSLQPSDYMTRFFPGPLPSLPTLISLGRRTWATALSPAQWFLTFSHRRAVLRRLWLPYDAAVSTPSSAAGIQPGRCNPPIPSISQRHQAPSYPFCPCFQSVSNPRSPDFVTSSPVVTRSGPS